MLGVCRRPRTQTFRSCCRVKLLLDENLSDKIVPLIIDLYPGSSHVKAHNLLRSEDSLILSFARNNDFAIVSKDCDFHQSSLVYGAPPKLIFLRAGNGPTTFVTQVLRSNFPLISEFLRNRREAVLVLC